MTLYGIREIMNVLVVQSGYIMELKCFTGFSVLISMSPLFTELYLKEGTLNLSPLF